MGASNPQNFAKTLKLLALFLVLSGSEGNDLHFPAEHDKHDRTFMTFPGTRSIWYELLPQVQRDIARVASAIAEYERVTLITSPKDYDRAYNLVSRKVDILQFQVDDLWARDTVPVFVFNTTQDQESSGTKRTLIGTDYNFNGWGRKQFPHDSDAALARKLLNHLDIPRHQSELVAEGGSLETDGDGTLLATESSIINDNRNKGKTKSQIEEELKRDLGVQKVIWFPGIYGKDITDAHVDAFVRFARPGRVIITRPCPGCPADDIWSKAAAEAEQILRGETDAKGRPFEIVDLFEPDRKKIKIPPGYGYSFVSTYVNFYVFNGGVIIPKFGDKTADDAAIKVMEQEFPGRSVLSVEINGVAAGGGGIHCATHELPASD